jgi:DNA processing protein
MSALTEVTVIVEASETPGTLIQARAALWQHRKLFILDSRFRDKRPHVAAPVRRAGLTESILSIRPACC